MTQYFNGMIWIDPMWMIPKNPKEALKYIKKMREPSINRVIEAMENSELYQLDNLRLAD